MDKNMLNKIDLDTDFLNDNENKLIRIEVEFHTNQIENTQHNQYTNVYFLILYYY